MGVKKIKRTSPPTQPALDDAEKKTVFGLYCGSNSRKKSFSEIIYDTHSQGTNSKYLIFTHAIALLDDCS